MVYLLYSFVLCIDIQGDDNDDDDDIPNESMEVEETPVERDDSVCTFAAHTGRHLASLQYVFYMYSSIVITF